VLPLLALLALLAGCGGGSNDDNDLAKPFSYDTDKAFDPKTRPTNIGTQGVDVREITIKGPRASRLPAYLAMPEGSGPHPAIVYVHGAGGDRLELLEQAEKMARQGVVTMTLTMSYSPTRAPQLPPGIEAIRVRTRVEVDAVREVRRAVDYLQSLPEVDDDRIGYVGWSAGARTGAIVAGVDHRIGAFDLLGGGATPAAEYLSQAPAEVREIVEPLIVRTDPLRYVGHASPSALLFQNANNDSVVPRQALEALAEEGSDPKEVRWYESDHVPTEQTWAESRRWLSDQLDLG
jgi:dienelactone hydrolase